MLRGCQLGFVDTVGVFSDTVYVCVCVCVCVSVYVCACAYVCAYASMCVCLFLCVGLLNPLEGMYHIIYVFASIATTCVGRQSSV